jgi:hypothetical protein
MGESFPSHFVILFDTKDGAVERAVEILVEQGEAEWVADKEGWTMGDEYYSEPQDLLENWQEGLDVSECFHVMPVQ